MHTHFFHVEIPLFLSTLTVRALGSGAIHIQHNHSCKSTTSNFTSTGTAAVSPGPLRASASPRCVGSPLVQTSDITAPHLQITQVAPGLTQPASNVTGPWGHAHVNNKMCKFLSCVTEDLRGQRCPQPPPPPGH